MASLSPFTYRAAQVDDALDIVSIYRGAHMLHLDSGIEPGSIEEVKFWEDRVNSWRWHIIQPSQHFFIAIDSNDDSVVGVIRGGVIYNKVTGAMQSLLSLHLKEVDCKEATDSKEIVQYGVSTEKLSEEQELGPVIRVFDAEVNGLFVKEGYQSRGIGKRLLHELFQSFRCNSSEKLTYDVHNITVWTWVDNTRAIQFYEREGARRVGCRKRVKAIVRLAFDR